MTKGLSLFDKRRRRNRTALRARSGTRPRLSVHRSGKHIYAQVIDDAQGRTVAAASTLAGAVEDVLSVSTSDEFKSTVNLDILFYAFDLYF